MENNHCYSFWAFLSFHVWYCSASEAYSDRYRSADGSTHLLIQSTSQLLPSYETTIGLVIGLSRNGQCGAGDGGGSGCAISWNWGISGVSEEDVGWECFGAATVFSEIFFRWFRDRASWWDDRIFPRSLESIETHRLAHPFNLLTKDLNYIDISSA